MLSDRHQSQAVNPLANTAFTVVGIVCLFIIFLLIAFIIYGAIRRPQWLINLLRRWLGHTHAQNAQSAQTSSLTLSEIPIVEIISDVSLSRAPSPFSEISALHNGNQPLPHILTATDRLGPTRAPDGVHTIDRSRQAASNTELHLIAHTDSENSLPPTPESVNVDIRDAHVDCTNADTFSRESEPLLQRGVSDATDIGQGCPGRCDQSSGYAARDPSQSGVQITHEGSGRGNQRLESNGNRARNHHRPQPEISSAKNTRDIAPDVNVRPLPQQPIPNITINNHVNNNFIDNSGTHSSGHGRDHNITAANATAACDTGTEAFHPTRPSASGPPHSQGCHTNGHDQSPMGGHPGGCRDDRLHGVAPTRTALGEEDRVVFAIDHNNLPPNARHEQEERSAD